MKNKKSIIFLISFIVILTAVYFILFFLKENRTGMFGDFPLNQKKSEEEVTKKVDEYIDEVSIGYLVKMNENSIDFISLENSRNNNSEEDRQKKVETFYISLNVPVTPVFRGIEDEKENALLSDLKVGQEILVQYNKETKNAIRININEAIKK